MVPLNKLVNNCTRRDMLKLAAYGAAGATVSGWLDVVAGNALAQEQQRRADRLRALARREAGLRQTEQFKGVQAFTVALQAKFEGERKQRERERRALEVLLAELRVRDAAEQKEIRGQLAPGGLPEGYAERVAHKRAEVKRAFRQAAERGSEDAVAFDRLVDTELDRLLVALRRR